jgi:predicted MFS family arabinose efflux permease
VVLALMRVVLPPLRGHLTHAPREVLREFVGVLSDPGHLRAFALMTALTVSTFVLFPYLPSFLVNNVGMAKEDLKWIYFCGGLATLGTLPLCGWLADRFGKLRVFRALGGLTVVPILLLTNLPAGLALAWVLAVTTLLMVASSGRMAPSMALITACAAPRRRGAFLSVNSSVQQLAMALAAVVGGLILGQAPPAGEGAAAEIAAPLTGFNHVGWLGAAMALLSLYLAGRLRPAAGGMAAVDAAAPALPEMDLTPFAPSAEPAPLDDAVQDAAPMA